VVVAHLGISASALTISHVLVDTIDLPVPVPYRVPTQQHSSRSSWTTTHHKNSSKSKSLFVTRSESLSIVPSEIKVTMRSRSSSSTAFVSSNGWSAPTKLSKDGKRILVEPLGMFTGLEGVAFNFIKDVAMAGATGGTGDIIAQLVAEKKRVDGKEEDINGGDIAFFAEADNFELDVRRTLSYTAFAALYTGGFQHFLFSNLQEALPDPIVRVAVNQGLIIPLCYYSLFIFLVPKLRARSKEEEEEIRGSINLMKMIPRNWAFWVPLQFVQFNFIPMEFQVIYCSFLGLIWNVCLSFFTAGSSAKEAPLTETVMNNSQEALADVAISVAEGQRTGTIGLLNALRSAQSPNLASTSKKPSEVGSWSRLFGNNSLPEGPQPTEGTKEEQENFLSSVFGRRQ
jgi:Mpv17 / PMP22 family